MAANQSQSTWNSSSNSDYSAMFVPDSQPAMPSGGQYSQADIYAGTNLHNPNTFAPSHDEFQFISSSDANRKLVETARFETSQYIYCYRLVF